MIMKKRTFKIMILLFFMLLLVVFSFRQYQKKKILVHINKHISILKQVGNEINSKSLQSGDDEYLTHILELVIESIDEYYEAYYIREKYSLWGGGFISLNIDFRIITDQASYLLDCIGNGTDEELKETYLLYIQSDLTNIASYMEKYYPEGVKKSGDLIYRSSTWKEYERELMNFGLGRLRN